MSAMLFLPFMPLYDTEPDTYYACQRCAKCCKWPGDIIVTEDEVAKIAAFLGIELDHFVQNYTRLSANRTALSLIDKVNGECHFLDKNECTIQPVKPFQCSGFPNRWNFPGWRDSCEALPVKIKPSPSG